MAEVQMNSQMKFKIASLQSQLADKQKKLDQYMTIELQANNKINAINKMHSDKIKNLLNSIQILKKQKASIEGLSKQHKRSKLIEQLNKEIGDQDLAIEVLRKYIYDKDGKEKGRNICDEIIVKALTKGPQRIRPLSRQELKMEIDRLKYINLNLEAKIKGNGGGGNNNQPNNKDDDGSSSISGISQKSYANHDEVVLNRIKDLQFENQNMKLQVNSKMKIIEKLKNELKNTEKLKVQIEVLKNQIDIANRKILTYDRLMNDSKDATNAKIVQLRQRQIKAEEFDSLNKENEELILENITLKKKQDQQKNALNQIKDLNSKQKDELKEKLKFYESQIQKVVDQNQKYEETIRKIEAELFGQRAKWVQQKVEILDELEALRKNKGQAELIGKYMQDIDELSKQNKSLKEVIEQGGTGGGDDTWLLERIKILEARIKELQGGKTSESGQAYNQLFKKFSELSEEFENYKEKYGILPKKIKHKDLISITRKQQSEYGDMSSDISKLNLAQVDSDILDNFDSSYEYELVITQDGKKVKIPKTTQADRELLKLINSDIWYFVEDQGIKMDNKIQEASLAYSDEENYQQSFNLKQKIRKIKNLSHPKGTKVTLYEEELDKLDQLSQNVSVTSGLPKQLEKYDSDVDLNFEKVNYELPKNVNMSRMKNMTISSGSEVSVKSIDSRIFKKKQQEKASVIGVKNNNLKMEKISSDVESVNENVMLNSDVSSVGISQSELNKIDSDVEFDFAKKHK